MASACTRTLTFPLYPNGTPWLPGSPDTKWLQVSPRGPQSLAQPRWWVSGWSLEGIRGWVTDSSHSQSPALSPKPPRCPPFFSPRLLSPAPAAQSGLLSPVRMWDQASWGQTHLPARRSLGPCSALEESPCERLALSPELISLPREPPDRSPHCPGPDCGVGPFHTRAFLLSSFH